MREAIVCRLKKLVYAETETDYLHERDSFRRDYASVAPSFVAYMDQYWFADDFARFWTTAFR